MRRAIVHIGLPRTGTTSIQHLLYRHREELRAAGIVYPDLPLAGAGERHINHQHLGEALDGRLPRHLRRNLLAELEAVLDGAETLLLSYEGLSLIPWWRLAPARLARLLRRHGFAMEVLATVKPQAELLNSTYTWRMQFLRERRGFDAFFRAELGSAKIDLARRIGRWLPAAGGRLTLVPVRDRLSDAPLTARIAAILGLKVGAGTFLADDMAIRENPSPGPLAIAADLRLRRMGAHRRVGERAREATRLVETLARENGDDILHFNGLDDVKRVKATARWRTANDRLARLAWNCDWADRVADEPAMPVNEHPADATDPRVETIVAEVLARFGKD